MIKMEWNDNTLIDIDFFWIDMEVCCVTRTYHPIMIIEVTRVASVLDALFIFGSRHCSTPA